MKSAGGNAGAARRAERGAAMAEAVIALPLLGLVIGAAIQLSLLFEAKSSLNHATLQAARAGMVTGASADAIVDGLAFGLVPLFSPAPGADGIERALKCYARLEVAFNACVRVVNPTREAFDDHAQRRTNPASRVLPIDNLQLRPTTLGASSGINVQDANLLKLRIVYGVEPRIPIVGPLIASALALDGDFDPFEQDLLAQGRIPVVASATVRMQSPIVRESPIDGNRLFLSRASVESGSFCAAGSESSFFTNEQAQCLASAAVSARPDDAVTCGVCAASIAARRINRSACFQCSITVAGAAQCLFTPGLPSVCD